MPWIWCSNGRTTVNLLILVFSKLILAITKCSASFGSSRYFLLRTELAWVSNEVSKYNILEFDACNLTHVPSARQLFYINDRIWYPINSPELMRVGNFGVNGFCRELCRLDFRRALVSGLPSPRGRSAGSFPEQRLVIEPRSYVRHIRP